MYMYSISAPAKLNSGKAEHKNAGNTHLFSEKGLGSPKRVRIKIQDHNFKCKKKPIADNFLTQAY
jgi:hypothetical protein